MNTMNNTSFSNFHRNQQHCVADRQKIFVVIQSIVAASSTLPNIMVVLIYAMMKKKSKKMSNFLLFNQAIADLWISTSLCYELGLILLLKRSTSPSISRILLLVNIGMLEFSLVLSLGTLLVASFERYLSIVKTYFHKCYVTILRLVYATIIVWFVSLIPTLTFLSFMRFNPHASNWYVTVYSYSLDAILLCVMLLIVYMLTITLKTARSSCSRKIVLSLHYSNISRRRELETIARKQSTKILVIFLAMLSVYCVSLLPFIVGRVCFDTGMFSNTSPCDQMTIAFVCHLFYKSSSVINPFLTLFCKEDYRTNLVDLLKRFCDIVLLRRKEYLH